MITLDPSVRLVSLFRTAALLVAWVWMLVPGDAAAILPPPTVSVTLAGGGSGVVSSSPAGIFCPAGTCSLNHAYGTEVTLTASADPGSVFGGWSGSGCSGTGDCVVVAGSGGGTAMVTATFTSTHPRLTVLRAGTGEGAVTSSPAGIDCGSFCESNFPAGTEVTLAAAPAPGFSFAGWSEGGCSGTGACVVMMSAPTTVRATFTPVTGMLTVNRTGSGRGTVTSSPMGISCGSVCSASFAYGTSVTLTATADSGSVFAAWQSVHCHARGSCVEAVGEPVSVAAVFDSLNRPRLANLSTRAEALGGDNVLIAGFAIGASGATGNKTVVVRARGPSLAGFGLGDPLANPTLQLVRAPEQTTIATNDDWQSAANAMQVAASGFAPQDSRESAILVTLATGPYTAIVTGSGGGTGIALVEVFEVDRPEVPLLNLATRGLVQTGDSVMIAGLIVQGEGPKTVVLRARGPSLTALGVPGALANPRLSLYSGQMVIASNDDYRTASNLVQLQASGFAPADDRESAILITLNPGAYTAIVSGAGGTTGVGIVEVFAVP